VKKNNPNTVSKIVYKAEKMLTEAGIENSRFEAQRLLAHIMGLDYKELLTCLTVPLPESIQQEFWQLITQRGDKEPLQYLTGIQEFMSLEFEVNSAVLIPRWDTERLVELVLEHLKRGPGNPSVVDVGTGSGAIVVSLAKYFPQAKYFAVDISSAALEMAQRNARRHGVDNKITFIEGDLLTPFLYNNCLQTTAESKGQFNLIVSNPPYISRKEISSLPEDVQKEPLLALDGGKDGLDLYRRLIPQAVQALLPGGCIFTEIGCDQVGDVSALYHHNGFINIKVFQDYGNRDRVICSQRKNSAAL
jgi:release factor glutamine methyltransferase